MWGEIEAIARDLGDIWADLSATMKMGMGETEKWALNFFLRVPALLRR